MLIVGMGGTTRPASSSETALRTALEAATRLGAEVLLFSADQLKLPMYDPADGHRTPEAKALVDAIERADGFVLSSPGYHGTISGLVKNALDYTEDLVDAPRPYFDGRAVGCISVAYGWQAAVNTLSTLRDIAHALRGWPTPYGAAINAMDGPFKDGRCVHPGTREGLELVGRQVVEFAQRSQHDIVA